MCEIRKIYSNEVDEAIALIDKVFMEFEAPEYSQEGVNSFKRSITENKEFIAKCRLGEIPVYAAFDDSENDKMIGIMGINAKKNHINLAFVKKEYHRKGIGTALFKYILQDISDDVKEITLNSSPYGLPFYLHLGFVKLSEEKETDGIRYTPMKYMVAK